MPREYSLDDKISRYLAKAGIQAQVKSSIVISGDFTRELTGVINAAKLDALIEEIKNHASA